MMKVIGGVYFSTKCDIMKPEYALRYNGTQYYYRHNLQGDVIAIVDRNADTVAKYTYDAWGKVLSVTNASGAAQTGANFIGNINPIRYRGYYYDTDLGLYYLQSRYYDPETGRFVNGDGYVQTGDGLLDKNMFAYCLDDPVNMADPSGRSCHAMGSGGYGPLCFFANGRCVTHGTVDCCGLGALSSSGIDWNKFKNSDGSYSLYDNRRHSPNNVFHEQILSITTSGGNWSLKNRKLGLGSYKITIMNGGWEWDHVDLSLLDVGTAKIAAGLQMNGNFELSAMATAWDPSIAFKWGDYKVTLTASIGSVGGNIEIGASKFNIAGAMGAGFGINVEW